MPISECYVWKWLPGATNPVVAGVLRFDGNGKQAFAYGRSYLDRADAESIYEPELPLESGTMLPLGDLKNFPSIRDAAPDAWGRRVINARLTSGEEATELNLDEAAYLMHSGSDRIGALDFQESPIEYVPRTEEEATLEQLYEASEIIAAGDELPCGLNAVLLHGSSIGGARPKASITGDDAKWIAKFSTSSDTFDIVKSEYVAMRLAELAGIETASVRLESAAGRSVLLVKRFDREKTDAGWTRRSLISGLTVLGLDERWAQEASYAGLVDGIRREGVDFAESSRELFARMVFNVVIGNTDDHARNHAFFVEGQNIQLTPAYDICPFPRTGGEAGHGMQIFQNSNLSRLENCVRAAGEFGLSEDEAVKMITSQIEVVTERFVEVCDEAGVPAVTRKLLWHRAVLNPDIFSGELEFGFDIFQAVDDSTGFSR